MISSAQKTACQNIENARARKLSVADRTADTSVSDFDDITDRKEEVCDRFQLHQADK
jgi:hypothetical protein